MPIVRARLALAVTAAVAIGLSGCGANTTAHAGSAAPGTVSVGGLSCAAAPATPSRAKQFDSAPDPSTVKGETVTATITTTCGDIVVDLLASKAPQTVASFAQLAKGNYWNNSPCHRLTTEGIFVLQCGDPTGTGNGNPGYGYGIENAPATGQYPAGTLAMARTNDPDSNGGQFFIVYDATRLPTDGGGYSIFGTVTHGLPIVAAIAAAGVEGGTADGPPAQPISILKVVLTEQKA